MFFVLHSTLKVESLFWLVRFRYPFKVKHQEVIRAEQWCPDVNISSRSWKPEAQIEIPNCIKGHCPSLPVCVPNPVLAMFHYLNYYHLTQRWTQPRTLPQNYRWVERDRGGERRAAQGRVLQVYKRLTRGQRGWRKLGMKFKMRIHKNSLYR